VEQRSAQSKLQAVTESAANQIAVLTTQAPISPPHLHNQPYLKANMESSNSLVPHLLETSLFIQPMEKCGSYCNLQFQLYKEHITQPSRLT
jgi:hypothetical protein